MNNDNLGKIVLRNVNHVVKLPSAYFNLYHPYPLIFYCYMDLSNSRKFFSNVSIKSSLSYGKNNHSIYNSIYPMPFEQRKSKYLNNLKIIILTLEYKNIWWPNKMSLPLGLLIHTKKYYIIYFVSHPLDKCLLAQLVITISFR